MANEQRGVDLFPAGSAGDVALEQGVEFLPQGHAAGGQDNFQIRFERAGQAGGLRVVQPTGDGAELLGELAASSTALPMQKP